MGVASSRQKIAEVLAVAWNVAEVEGVKAAAGLEVNGLNLRVEGQAGNLSSFRSIYSSTSSTLHLGFWWNVRLLVLAGDGGIIQPHGGPQLPCGSAERAQELHPGAPFTRDQYLMCTQPAGNEISIGWSYPELEKGTNAIIYLVYENPPPTGYGIVAENGWRGRVVSNPLVWPPK